MKKLLLGAALVVTALMVGLAVVPNAGATEQEAHKWYVCKYVGPPGSGEVLQTGNNPIFVDENAIDTSPVFIGATFGDAQTHSLVVAGPFFEALEVDPVCPGETPPPGVASAALSAPTCLDLFIRATGTNLTDLDEVTFSIFKNGVLVDNFVVGNGLQGVSPGIGVVDGDVITVKLLGGEVTLATRTIDLDCQPGGGGGGGGGGGVTPTSCPGKINVSRWYGDPQINIILTGEATFVVSGGLQRSTGLRRITKTLDCDERFKIRAYKVRKGHFLNISMDGVRIVHVQPPVLR